MEGFEEALIHFARAHAVPPPPKLKESILNKIRSLKSQLGQRRQLALESLPRLTEHPNYFDWFELTASLQPPEDYDVHLHPLERTPRRDLFVVWARAPIPEEVHHDLLESFLILEGTCACRIRDENGSSRIVKLGPGDLLSLEKGETHDIYITSAQPVKAILEWWYSAA
ncbi:MAG: cupin domain-containing protein [Bacteroidetes bacterium]|nr:MAG: cupin domain-containing protein [Bacteroidota bacterium]